MTRLKSDLIFINKSDLLKGKAIVMSVYLVTYTIHDKYDENGYVRKQFKDYLNKKSTPFLDTTVIYKSEDNSEELCQSLYNEFKRIVNEFNFIVKFIKRPSIEIGVFSINMNSFVHTKNEVSDFDSWYKTNKINHRHHQ